MAVAGSPDGAGPLLPYLFLGAQFFLSATQIAALITTIVQAQNLNEIKYRCENYPAP